MTIKATRPGGQHDVEPRQALLDVHGVKTHANQKVTRDHAGGFSVTSPFDPGRTSYPATKPQTSVKHDAFGRRRAMSGGALANNDNDRAAWERTVLDARRNSDV